MGTNIYINKRKEKAEKEAIKLYKQGFSLRKVAGMMDKSHEWVRYILKKHGVDN